ncbi:MAG: hypothetical protein QM758_15920 [Armatimonas sp.]
MASRGTSLALVLTALWQLWLLSAYPSYLRWLSPAPVLALLTAYYLHRFPTKRLSITLCALAALLIAPLVWCISAAVTYCNAPLVYAGPHRFSKDGPDPALMATPQIWQGRLTDADRPKLLTFLKKERHGEPFLLAVQSTVPAAPVILHTGEAVMAMGGFTGGDPILTPDTLAARVARREVRFFLLPPNNARIWA